MDPEPKETICWSARLTVLSESPNLISSYGHFLYTKDPDGKTLEGGTTCKHKGTITTDLSAGGFYIHFWATSANVDLLNGVGVSLIRLTTDNGKTGDFGGPY